MIDLSKALKLYNFDIKIPTSGNRGWSLDIYSPESIYLLKQNCFIQIKAGFGLLLPEGIGGIITPKNSSYHFSVSPGQIIHPEDDCELTINLLYHGLTGNYIKKDEPLCQIIFCNRVKINESNLTS